MIVRNPVEADVTDGQATDRGQSDDNSRGSLSSRYQAREAR